MPIDPSQLAPGGPALEALGDHLPWWTERLALPTYLAFVFLTSRWITLFSIAVQPGMRALRPEMHWVEKAQVVGPVFVSERIVRRVLIWFAVAVGVLGERGLVVTAPLFPLLWPILGSIAAVLGWEYGRRVLNRYLGRPFASLRQVVLGLPIEFLLSAPVPLVAWLGATLMRPSEPFYSLLVWAVFASVLVLLSLRYFVFVARGLGLLKAPEPRLVAALDRAMYSTGEKDVRLYEVDSFTSGAMALPFSRDILVLTPLKELSEPQLEAVLRHELGHLKESGGDKAFRLIGVVPWLGVVALPLGIAWIGFWSALLILGLLFVIRSRWHRRSLRLERAADAVAHGGDRESGEDFARAVEAIHRHNLWPVVWPPKARATHPSLVERMQAAGVEPDWEIPEPRELESWEPITSAASVVIVTGVLAIALSVLSHRGGAVGRAFVPLRPFGLYALADSALTSEEIVLYRAALATVEGNSIDCYRAALAFGRSGLDRDVGLAWLAYAETRPAHWRYRFMRNRATARWESEEEWSRMARKSLGVSPDR